MQNLMNDLTKLFQKDERILADGKLLKNKLTELALKLDQPLIELLLSDGKAKEHFFIEKTVKNEKVLVFDKDKFIAFVNNKEFLPDSFTSFKNKIGLMTNGEYLKEKSDVVLAWAYKDCVLEGGQDKEDQKRDEIFYNETLSPDEIDRLFEPKVLTNFKKYDSNGEHKVTEFNTDDNLIIKGNNLLALHCLKQKFRGQAKLIYIDPPYNTGNDEFKYNDTFNHSTWLTFIRNRLNIAREFLSQDGAIFISIDENELGYLLVLCDEIFGESNRANIISVKRGSLTGHKAINPGAVNITEYIVCYCKSKPEWKPNRVFIGRERNIRYNNFILNRQKDARNWKFCSLMDIFSEHLKIPKSKIKKQLGDEFEKKIFSFILENADSVIQFAYPDIDKVSGELKILIEKSRKSPHKVFYFKREDDPDVYLYNGQKILFYSERLIKVEGEFVTGEPLSDFWDDVLPNDLHNEGGVKLKKGKKPEKLLQRILELGSNPNDLILDFYLGSGTSACVALKMNRRFVGIEQLNYEENGAVTRLLNTINGEQSGISKSANWKGGGDFMYAELIEWNEQYMTDIQGADTSRKLLNIYEKMGKEAFFRYDVKLSKFEEKGFEKLPLKEQKRILCECLDKNHLYVNLSEIDDATYKVSADDKKLNKEFYKTVV